MQLFKLASLFYVAALASAINIITFESLDTTDRVIYFTANAGLEEVPPLSVPGGQSVQVVLPDLWIGNWYSVSDGAPNVPGMLAEVSFTSWGSLTFFDVSAIVNPGDIVGVHQLYPTGDNPDPIAGCVVFPCNEAYYQPDDVQTKATTSSELTCTLGTSTVDARGADNPESPSFPRTFVERRW